MKWNFSQNINWYSNKLTNSVSKSSAAIQLVMFSTLRMLLSRCGFVHRSDGNSKASPFTLIGSFENSVLSEHSENASTTEPDMGDEEPSTNDSDTEHTTDDGPSPSQLSLSSMIVCFMNSEIKEQIVIEVCFKESQL